MRKQGTDLFTIVVMCVARTIITKLARNYGIEKTGWLGVGAKGVLVLFVLSWLIVAVVYAGMRLLSYIATRPIQVIDEAELDRVGSRFEHNRNDGGGGFRCAPPGYAGRAFWSNREYPTAAATSAALSRWRVCSVNSNL